LPNLNLGWYTEVATHLSVALKIVADTKEVSTPPRFVFHKRFYKRDGKKR